jgi:dihydrofolate reductase
MRRIVLYMFTTLDGFIAGPHGEFDDYEPSPEEMDFANELFDSLGGILFGRVTYEQFVGYWDSLDPLDTSVDPRDAEFARIFRRTPRIVFSRTLTVVPDGTILLTDELAAQVDELKRQPGDDLALICGPELLSTLVRLGLVDECIILVKPKATGRGLALFGELGQTLSLQLLTTRVFESGIVKLHYRVS